MGLFRRYIRRCIRCLGQIDPKRLRANPLAWRCKYCQVQADNERAGFVPEAFVLLAEQNCELGR